MRAHRTIKNMLITLIVVQIKWNLLECFSFMVKWPDRTIYHLQPGHMQCENANGLFFFRWLSCLMVWFMFTVINLSIDKIHSICAWFLIDNTCMSPFICKHFLFACVALICPCFITMVMMMMMMISFYVVREKFSTTPIIITNFFIGFVKASMLSCSFSLQGASNLPY